MNKILDSKIIKFMIVYIVPIGVGAIFSALGSWDKENDKWFWYKVVAAVILMVIYGYASWKYYKKEKEISDKIIELNDVIKKHKKKIEIFENKNNAFSKATRALATLCLDSSNSINVLSKAVLSGNRTLYVWNFKKVATGICNSVYDLLCEICKPYDDFTVNIVLDDVTATGKKRNVTMIAHKGKYEQYPGKFEEKMYYEKHRSFYAIKLFKNGGTDIKILTTKEEVNEKFVYVDEEHPEYSQYVGIPIVCSGNKMICLLQICAFKEEKIADTKSEILDIIKTYIIPFVHFALLNYKIEKGFVSGFSVIEKLEERIYE